MSGHDVSQVTPQDQEGQKLEISDKRSAAQPKGPGSHNISQEARQKMAEGGRKGGTLSRRGPASRNNSSAT